MNTLFRKAMPLLGIFALSAACATVQAQCTSGAPAPGPSLQKESWQGDGSFHRDGLRTVVAQQSERDIDRDGNHDSDHDSSHDRNRTEAVVGFWRVLFVAKGTPGIPDGTVIDRAFAQWHDDGTEITNSSRPPISSSFCLGVWKKVGESTYRLNHFAISWDNSGNYTGTGNIRETVVVSKDRKSFTGTFTIDQYDASGNNLLQHVQGELAGQRIDTSTTVQGLI